ncbi:hypothetical protein HELRODRAFT_103014 [Helobdella robusta]|uniref:Major facilitator superfamily (MFS) profile domain-containing protein n=1 Tax=Helobdella robusta TaxID=6412 RepID=T1EDD8_HELRO|nr:hypothetical protein HELRODRAFT_103014 [Helobdella robusta]ESN94063.1 hypothetical protein HELRODRAFT_103014 [Helobdella robusta]
MSNEYESIPDNKTNLERLVSLAGYGWFSYKLIFLCGVVVASDAIEILSVSYIIPPATCDMDLDDQKKGWINASIFIGMTVGAIFWGCLADVTGRKTILIFSLAFNGFFNLASGLSNNFYSFVIFRLLSGFGVGGNVPVIYTYNSEFQTNEHRGKLLTFMVSFWAYGGMIAAGVAWALLPVNLSIQIHINYVLKSWNVYLSLCSLPTLVSMCFMMFMPESPKFLLEHSRMEEMKQTMLRIFKQNNPNKDISEFERGKHEQQRHNFESSATFNNSHQIWKRLFSKEIVKTSIVATILFNVGSFGYYGMFMWFPELFKRSAANNGSICQSHDQMQEWKHLTNQTNPVKICEVPTLIYYEGFFVVFSKLFGYSIILLFIDYINRKPLLCISMIISGLCAFLIWFTSSSTQIFIASCFYAAVTSAMWSVVDVTVAESFPTNLRSTAFGFCGGTGRISSAISNIVFGYMLGVYCFLPFLVISAVFWLGAGLSCLLKETKHSKS